QGYMEEWARLRKQLRYLPARDPHDPNYRRLRYTRYADDFLLGFSGPREEAEEIKVLIWGFLRGQMHLELSPEKTLVTHAQTDKAGFLGYEIAVQYSESRRKVNGVIELRVPAEVPDKVCTRYERKGTPHHRTILTHSSDYEIVAAYGAEYR